MLSVAFLLAATFTASATSDISSFALQETPVTNTNPPLQESLSEPQNLEGLVLLAPIKLEQQPEVSPIYRVYFGQVKTTTNEITSTTEVISVVVTDLDKIEPRPTADQVCDLHDRASRTRKDMAGQLFKTERTTINDKSMVINIGTLIALDAAQKPTNMYQVSAAFSSDTKAYEITWLTVKGGVTASNAIKSVRNASLQIDDKIYQPKLLVGTSGKYSLLGVPFNFILPSPAESIPDNPVSLEESGRYTAEVAADEWFASVEVAIRKSPITDPSPKNLLKLLGFEEWVTPNIEFKTEKGISICADIPISEERHARVEIAVNGTTICAVIVSATKDQPLPSSETIGLQRGEP